MAGRRLDLVPARLYSGQLQQVLDQRLKPVGVVLDRRHETTQRGRIVHGAVQQRLDIALDGGQRRPQFVGHVGHEVFPDLLESPQFGHVVEHGDYAVKLLADAYGGQVYLEDVLAPLQRQVEHGVRVQGWHRVDGGVHRALQVMVANHLDRPLVQTPGVHLHHALESRVDHQDTPFRRGQHDAFGHAGEHGFELGVFFPYLCNPFPGLPGHLVQRGGQIVQFGVRRRRSRDREIAAGLAPGHLRHAFDRAGYQSLRAPAQHDAQHEADGEGREHDLPDVGLDPLELLKGQRNTHDAPCLFGPKGHRDVGHVGLQRIAVTYAVSDSRRDGLQDFRAVAMVLHVGNGGKGNGRIAGHDAVVGHDRHPGPALFSQAVCDRIDGFGGK